MYVLMISNFENKKPFLIVLRQPVFLVFSKIFCVLRFI
ncbi:hypothetical protein RC62_1140 [Flavobacterium aquidurense]|uniref:Uncharacterized protein n=1 Tax=Flavobacterium aquidurense TaxID=362413 RepID=A0A0Q0XTF7_9FLAO|nr:hypothetical protein RC62_1140 [Flavobacterium aquidurense]